MADALDAVSREPFLHGMAFWLPEDPTRRHKIGDAPSAAAAAALASDRPLVVRDDSEGRIRASATSPSLLAHLFGLLDVRPGHQVLQLGTGTGYSAAVLAELAGPDGHVDSWEIDEVLARHAAACLAESGYSAVTVEVRDAMSAPIESHSVDRIFCSAAASAVRPEWLRALKPGGRLVTTTPLAWRGVTLSIEKIGETTAEGSFTFHHGRTCPLMIGDPYDQPMWIMPGAAHAPVDTPLPPFAPSRILQAATIGLDIFASWLIPGLRCVIPPGPPAVQFLDPVHQEGSIIVGDDGACRVSPHGGRLLAALRHTWTTWREAGSPPETAIYWSWADGQVTLRTTSGHLPQGGTPHVT